MVSLAVCLLALFASAASARAAERSCGTLWERFPAAPKLGAFDVRAQHAGCVQARNVARAFYSRPVTSGVQNRLARGFRCSYTTGGVVVCIRTASETPKRVSWQEMPVA